MLEPLEVVACPLCGSGVAKPVGSTAPSIVVTVGDLEFVQVQYQTLECQDCGLLYKDRTLSGQALDQYYSELPYAKWQITGFFPPERVVHQILARLPMGSKVLDFGCSAGRLLAPFCPSHSCFGVEVNEDASHAAAKRGIRMLSPLTWDAGRDSFDAIVMVDVFEHLPSPLDVVRRLASTLKPGGILIVSTGNADAEACRVDPAHFWYFRNVEHLTMLSRKSAEAIAAQLGLTLIDWSEVSHYDLSVFERIRQRLKNWIYWQAQKRAVRIAFRFVPILKRSLNWKTPPAITFTNDHVVVTYIKPAVV